MPIIYTYPVKASPAADDLILISDSADSNKTKQVKVSALPSSGAGITLTTTGTSGVATLTGSVLNIPNYTTTGGTLSVQDSGGTVVAGIDTLNFNTDIAVVTAPGSSTATVNVSGGSGTPGGSDTQMQYNNGAAFGGTTGLTWDDSTNILSIATRYEGDINGAILQQVLVKEPGGVSKGDVVYISGGTGDNPEVRKAQANSISTMAALGIMKNSTAVDVVGECVTSGEITGLNLTGFTTGDELFVSNTTAGGLLTSAPTGEANLVQKIGKVIKGGAGGALTVLGAFRTNATPNLNQGSLFIGNASNQATTLGIGGNNTVLTSNGTTASWAANTGGGITFSGSTADGLATFASTSSAAVNSEVKLLADGQMTFDGSSGNTGIKFDSGTNTLRVGDIVGNSDIVALYSDGAAKITVSDSDVLVADTMQFQQGLKFGVTGSTLSTYTEATWTSGPTLTFSVGGTATLSASSGSYRVIGDMVFAQFQFTFGSGGYGTADLSLPVSGIAGTGSINFVKMNSNVGNSTVSTPVTGNINFNSASIRLKSFNYDQDSASHVSGQLFELVDTSGQPIFQNGDIVSGTIIYRKA